MLFQLDYQNNQIPVVIAIPVLVVSFESNHRCSSTPHGCIETSFKTYSNIRSHVCAICRAAKSESKTFNVLGRFDLTWIHSLTKQTIYGTSFGSIIRITKRLRCLFCSRSLAFEGRDRWRIFCTLRLFETCSTTDFVSKTPSVTSWRLNFARYCNLWARSSVRIEPTNVKDTRGSSLLRFHVNTFVDKLRGFRNTHRS